MATEAVLTAVPMASQTSKLLRREEVAEGTMAFHFEKPSGFKFKAGQFVDVTLIEPTETDAEGNTKAYFHFPDCFRPLLLLQRSSRPGGHHSGRSNNKQFLF
jgi:hypothetical protein